MSLCGCARTFQVSYQLLLQGQGLNAFVGLLSLVIEEVDELLALLLVCHLSQNGVPLHLLGLHCIVVTIGHL